MIYLVRHGQTEWNKAGIAQGWLNSPLTNKGSHQARLAAEFLAKQNPTKIICSSLGRTIQTAEIIASRLNLKIQTFDWLREINVGKVASHTRDWIDENYPDFFPNREHSAENKLHNKYPEGESFYDVYEKLRKPLLDIATKETKLVVVAHNGTNRMIRSLLLNKKPIDYVNVRQKNNEVVMIDLAGKTEESLNVS